MKYLIANWKSTKDVNAVLSWVDTFNKSIDKDKILQKKLNENYLKIIICPSFHLLYPVKQNIYKNKNITLGAQNVSFFDQGNYTGEVSAQNIKDLVDYSIVGHSERRKYLKEKDNEIDQKAMLLKDYDIEPILCVRNEKDLIPDKINLIAYEPVFAIGTGESQALRDIINVKNKINTNKNYIFIYGGSVNSNNISQYLQSTEISGFLVGNASKDPISFIEMATKI
ncbi:MAG: triose-phosphate isomerase family protein [bacterium]